MPPGGFFRRHSFDRATVSAMLTTQADWARRHGFSRRYVGQLVKRGVIRIADGKVDPAYAAGGGLTGGPSGGIGGG